MYSGIGVGPVAYPTQNEDWHRTPRWAFWRPKWRCLVDDGAFHTDYQFIYANDQQLARMYLKDEFCR